MLSWSSRLLPCRPKHPHCAGRVKFMKKDWMMALASMWVGVSPAASWEKLGSVEGQSCSSKTS